MFEIVVFLFRTDPQPISTQSSFRCQCLRLSYLCIYSPQTHALSVRRAVKGRSKSFDQLLLEHRGAKEAEALRKAKATGESSGKGLPRIAMATKTVTTTTTTTVMSNCNINKLGRQNPAQSTAAKPPMTNILSFSHTPK